MRALREETLVVVRGNGQRSHRGSWEVVSVDDGRAVWRRCDSWGSEWTLKETEKERLGNVAEFLNGLQHIIELAELEK